MLLYYITDRNQFSGDSAQRRCRLLEKIAEAALAGVDYIQLREKDLSARQLESLAIDAVKVIREAGQPKGSRRRSTNLLINSRADIAFAAHAGGVHLPANELSPTDVRNIWRNFGAGATDGKAAPIISVSTHTEDELRIAAQENANLAIFAPVFEKKISEKKVFEEKAFEKQIFEKNSTPEVSPAGLEALRQAARHQIPVLALGGVTLENAPACVKAGAAGIAAIRLFQENQISEVARILRA
jgi:thiamine-phosphate pyrophosphorylase